MHDVQRDRGEVCDAIARTLARLEGAAAGAAAEQEREAQDHERDHALATGRVAARLAATREAFELLAGAPGGRPGLAWLLERALSDDGRPLPDLREVAADATLASATGALPRIESLARQTAPLAAPHPLADRTDWSSRDLAAVFDAHPPARRADRRARDARRGARSRPARRTRASGPVGGGRAAPRPLRVARRGRDQGLHALVGLDRAATPRTAQWRRVTALLTEARRVASRPSPTSSCWSGRRRSKRTSPRSARLEELGARWYRGFTPEYWRLKKLPREILDRCPSFEGAEADAASVRRLCEAAIGWQELIVALPGDDVFWDFGLQGAVEDLDHAIERFRLEHARIAARARDLRGAPLRRPRVPLARRAGRGPRGARGRRALLRRGGRGPGRARRLGEIHAALAALARRPLGRARSTRSRTLCARRRFAAAARPAWTPCSPPRRSRGARPRGSTASSPPSRAWVQRFLRLYRPAAAADPGADAILALERAWVRVALGDRTSTASRQPLVDEAHAPPARRTSSRARQALAGRGALARFRLRALAAARDGKRGGRPAQARRRRRRRSATARRSASSSRGTGRPASRSCGPAWFCSPEAVSSLFPRSPDLFDVVVVDEASQCPVEAAVPALARARRAIVAGDDQQMPPSHFFRAAVDDAPDDDDEERVRARERLDPGPRPRGACPAPSSAGTTARRHEELVAFSNAAFYAGRLITAPRADGKTAPRVEGLHWEQVDGPGSTQTNPVEAARVVDAIGELLAAEGEGGAPPSIGVVAFNRKQAELDRAKIDARAAEDDAFRRLVERDRAREPRSISSSSATSRTCRATSAT